MEKVYKTNRQIVKLKNNWIEIHNVITERKDWVYILILYFMWIGWTFYHVFTYSVDEKDFFRIIIFTFIFSSLLIKAFKILFLDYWPNRFKISKIKSIEVLNSENDLETSIRINIGYRRKILTFRKDEDYLENFLNEVSELLPANKVYALP